MGFAIYEIYQNALFLATKIVRLIVKIVRLGLYDGPCPNLLRGDKVLIFVPSDC